MVPFIYFAVGSPSLLAEELFALLLIKEVERCALLLEADCQKKIPLVGEKSVGKGRVCFESSISRGFSSKGSRLLFEVLAQKISLSQSPSSKQGNLLKEKRDDDHNMPPFEKDGQEQCPLRRQTKREMLLRLDKSQLTKQMSFRGNHCDEILHVARDANSIIRSHYKDCIHQVGRNSFHS